MTPAPCNEFGAAAITTRQIFPAERLCCEEKLSRRNLFDEDRVLRCLHRFRIFLKRPHVLKIQLRCAFAHRFKRPHFFARRARSAGIGRMILIADLLQHRWIRRRSQSPAITRSPVRGQSYRKLFARQHAYFLDSARYVESTCARSNLGGPRSSSRQDVRDSRGLEISVRVKGKTHRRSPNFSASVAAVAQ